ncbi:hypothetical protein [Aequitasia blattaphilus]|uniref:Uncharacterized protein n=1 Tax=Aequitasia blattaphilus TaxID=2949332 RepID=A0ABT1E8J8_9FIRM|nr:hypothetical protein [Aequitasia blattaphilus]MCP1102149.1 hypothetical protein [Aequitasia blattaphilus]MCR8614789.1 hypothetical protein [Aequitasia blattaphilus]
MIFHLLSICFRFVDFAIETEYTYSKGYVASATKGKAMENRDFQIISRRRSSALIKREV